MKTKQAIKLAGSAANLARLLGVTPSAVSHFGANLPQGRMFQLRVERPQWFDASGAPKKSAPETAK